MIRNSFINTGTSNYFTTESLSLKNSSIEIFNKWGQRVFQNVGYGKTQRWDGNGAELIYNKTNLKNGDISVADFNNDGNLDLILTGEDKDGIPTTDLYIGENKKTNLPASGGYNKSTIDLIGLRESTVDWVDYDMDGDLDLFLTGIDSDSGAKAVLYETEIRNKKNVAPTKLTGLTSRRLRIWEN